MGQCIGTGLRPKVDRCRGVTRITSTPYLDSRPFHSFISLFKFMGLSYVGEANFQSCDNPTFY